MEAVEIGLSFDEAAIAFGAVGFVELWPGPAVRNEHSDKEYGGCGSILRLGSSFFLGG